MGTRSDYFRNLMFWKTKAGANGVLAKTSPLIDIKVMTEVRQMISDKITAIALTVPGDGNSHKWFSPKPWIDDSAVIKTYSEFRIMNAGFGNRKPAGDGMVYKDCPLCLRNGIIASNNEIHVLVECKAMEVFRNSCGVGRTIDMLRSVNPAKSSAEIFKHLLDDGDALKVAKRAQDLYYIKRGWIKLMGFE